MDNIFGNIDILEISDEFSAFPLNKFKTNSYIKARIISLNKNNEFILSAR